MTPDPTQAQLSTQVTPPAPVSFWAGEWRYPQTLTLVIGLVGVAEIVQAWHPGLAVQLPAAPWNWVVVFTPLLVLIVLRRVFGATTLLSGLGGIPMAVTAISTWTLVCLPGAIWPQGAEAPGWQHRLGLDHVISSLPFVASLGLVLMNLALAVGKRIYPWEQGTFPFLLVHAGLLLGLGSAAAGAGEVIRAQCVLFRDTDFTSVAFQSKEHSLELPFGLKLLDFRLDTFPPTLLLVRQTDTKTPQILAGHKFVSVGMEETIGPYTFRIEEQMPASAMPPPMATNKPSSSPVAIKISVWNENGTILKSGWMIADHRISGESGLPIGDHDLVLMQSGSPKLFESRVQIHTPDGKTQEAILQVNKPLSVSGWRLYQTGYDDRSGATSQYSIIEAVRDPSLPAVYTGLFLLLAGCTIHLWNVAKRVATVERQPEGRAEA